MSFCDGATTASGKVVTFDDESKTFTLLMDDSGETEEVSASRFLDAPKVGVQEPVVYTGGAGQAKAALSMVAAVMLAGMVAVSA